MTSNQIHTLDTNEQLRENQFSTKSPRSKNPEQLE